MVVQPPNRSYRIYAVSAMAGAGIGLVGNALHPHTVASDAAATVRAVAESGAWVAIHLAIIVAILLVIGGLAGLAQMLEADAADQASGAAEPLAQLGLAAAVLGGAVVTVSTAMDGFAMKALALTWTNAPAAEATTALRLAVAVKDVDFGIWSIGMLVFFGIAFVCLGAAASQSRRFPGWFGWIAVVSGAGSAMAALLQIANSGEVQAAETLFLASSLLITLWVFVLGALLWRGAAAARAAAAPLAAAA